jgi:hypothetical protein
VDSPLLERRGLRVRGRLGDFEDDEPDLAESSRTGGGRRSGMSSGAGSVFGIFVVFRFGIHFPTIVMAALNITCRQQSRHHGMVLIIVMMHAITTNGLQIGELTNPVLDHLQMLLVGLVIDGIGLRHSYDKRVLDFRGLDQADLFCFPDGQLSQVVIGGRPKIIALKNIPCPMRSYWDRAPLRRSNFCNSGHDRP